MTPLGCDDITHAIKTLAAIYQVGVGMIENVANGDWPDFLNAPDIDYRDMFGSPYLPSLMSTHLKASPNWDFGEVTYYHRAAYDGTPEWFEDGLLDSLSGARTFLTKAARLVCIAESDVALAIKNIEERNAFEGMSSGGPYAFDTFDDAKSAECTGLDYSLPEFFVGIVWQAKYGVSHAKELREQLHKVLKPVIIKFSAIPRDPDGYISNLWQYVYRAYQGEPMPPGCHYPCTFNGGGKPIPAQKIIEIFDLKNS